MKQSSIFLKALSAVALIPMVMVLNGCDEDNTTDPDGSGKAEGKLYVTAASAANNSDYSGYSINLTTGEFKQVSIVNYPHGTPEGTIIGYSRDAINPGLAEVSSDGNTFRMIVKEDIAPPIEIRYNDRFYNPRLSPDGKYIVYEGANAAIYVVNRNTGALVAQTSMGANPITGFRNPSWTQDGKIIFNGPGDENGIYISDMMLNNPVRIDPDLSNPVYPQVSPDGKRIAFINNKKLFLMNIDKSNLQEVETGLPADYEVSWPSWSPDSKSVAVFAGAFVYSIYVITPGNPQSTLALNDEAIRKRVNTSYPIHWVK